MLDIHPEAIQNFNKKADQILAFIRDIEPSNVHSPSFEPETHSAIQIDGSRFLNTPTYRDKDINDYTICLYPEMLNFDTKLYISRYSKSNQVKFSTKHEFLKPMNKTNFLTHTSLKIANFI